MWGWVRDDVLGDAHRFLVLEDAPRAGAPELDDIAAVLPLLVLQERVDVLREECRGRLRGHDGATKERWAQAKGRAEAAATAAAAAAAAPAAAAGRGRGNGRGAEGSK
jgi:hypothetical protein